MPDETIVLLNTGAGIKYPETVRLHAPELQPDDDLPLDLT
jgi:threonine synthase